MKRGSRILLFLILAIIILSAVAFWVLGRGAGGLFASAQPTEVAPMVNIVIAGQPIKRDDAITQDALAVMQIPQANLTDKMIVDTQAVVGKYALSDVEQGVMITVSMLAERPGTNQPGSDAAKVVSPGLVAISMPIDLLSSMAYGIRDGDRVNVIATTKFIDVDSTFQSKLPNFTAIVTGTGFVPDALPVLSANIATGGDSSKAGRAELDPTINQALYMVPSEAQRARLVSQMILQDIQVLHIGKFLLPEQEAQLEQQQAAPAEGQPTPVPVEPAPPAIITLIVTPQDAVALTYLMNSDAKFTLVLRAPDDTSRVETEAATLQYLLSQYAIPVPAKLPYVMDMPTPVPSPAP